MDDLISRQAAIETSLEFFVEFLGGAFHENAQKELIARFQRLSSAQSTEVQDILQYLDEYLHPIVSPKHWSVYSELYDMVSMLLPTQPEIIRCKDCRWKYINSCTRAVDLFTHDEDFCSYAERRTE